VGNLTRNVNEEHLREIFGQWGKLQRVELGWDRRIDQPKGFAYVEYEKYADSVEAVKRMDGVRISSTGATILHAQNCMVCMVAHMMGRASRSSGSNRRQRDQGAGCSGA
jgi:RNA recognition motif-containing protein